MTRIILLLMLVGCIEPRMDSTTLPAVRPILVLYAPAGHAEGWVYRFETTDAVCYATGGGGGGIACVPHPSETVEAP